MPRCAAVHGLVVVVHPGPVDAEAGALVGHGAVPLADVHVVVLDEAVVEAGILLEGLS